MDVTNFFQAIKEIYEELRDDDSGDVADYIPQLATADPNKFAVVVHTMDNQTLLLGDYKYRYCIQSCSKPLSYALAIMENGFNKVKKHINTEPSGKAFNAMEFDEDNKPHNAMINAGAIMSCSLIKPDCVDDERYSYIYGKWKSMLGNTKVGFDNEICMGEERTADGNYALARMMRKNRVFERPDISIERTIKFYLQTCSITMNAESMALFAAILANGGVSPITGKAHIPPDVVKSVLCAMSISGMYDYSGRWFYNVGLPAKSGVSGCLYVVIPNMCGICVFSPRLDKYGNSVRGVELFNRLTKRFRLHTFDSFSAGVHNREDVDRNMSIVKQVEIYNCCKSGDHVRLEQLLKGEINVEEGVNFCDHDDRYPLHIAVESGSIRCIWLLMMYGADYCVKDKWGMTPFKYAIENKLREVLLVLITGRRYRRVLHNTMEKWKSIL